MSRIAELMVRILGDASGLSEELKKTNRELLKLDGELGKNLKGFEKFGQRMTSVGAGLTAAITLPIVGIGAAAVNTAKGFEDAMKAVSARGEITGENLQKLEKQALDLGEQTAFSATAAAQGMAELAAQGFNTAGIMATMPGILDLAAAGGLSVARAAEIATAALHQFRIPAEKTGHVADVIAKSANAGALSVEDFGLSLGYVGPVAETAGWSLEQTAAAITLMSNQGVKGERAGTALRGALQSLLNPSKETQERLNALGITVRDASGQLLPLADIIEQFSKKSKDAGDAVAVFGLNASSGMQALINAGAPALRDLDKALQKADGSAKAAAETMQSGISGALERFSGSVETAAIKLGKVLAPHVIQAAGLLEKLADGVAAGIELFSRLPAPVQAVALGMAGLVAAAGPVVVIAGTMVSNFTTLAVAFSGATAAAGALRIALLALPWVGVAAAVSSAAVAVWEWVNASRAAAEARKDLADTHDDNYKRLMRLRDSLLQNAAATAEQKMRIWELSQQLKTNQISVDQFHAALRPIAMEMGRATESMLRGTEQSTKLREQLDTANKASAKASAAASIMSKEIDDWSGNVKRATAIHKEFIDPVNWDLMRRGFLSQAEAIEATKQRMAGWRQELQDSLRAKLAWLNAADQIPDVLRNPAPAPLPKIPGVVFPGADYDRGSEEDMIPDTAPPGARTPPFLDETRKKTTQVNEVISQMRHEWQRAWEMGGSALADLVTRGGKLSDVARRVGQDLARAIINAPLQAAMKHLGELMTSLSKKVLQLAMDHLPKLAGALSKVFGGITNSAGAVGTAAGAAGGLGKAAGSSAGGVATGIAGGLTGIVGAVGSVVSAISGVISNFQLARQENTLNAIEQEVRYSQIHLHYILDKANDLWPFMRHSHDRLAQIINGGLGIFNRPDSVLQVAMSVAGGAVSTINVTGNFIGFRDLDELVDAIVTRMKARGV